MTQITTLGIQVCTVSGSPQLGRCFIVYKHKLVTNYVVIMFSLLLICDDKLIHSVIIVEKTECSCYMW